MTGAGVVAAAAGIEVSSLAEVSSFSLFSSLITVPVVVVVAAAAVEQTTSMQIFLDSMTSLTC